MSIQPYILTYYQSRHAKRTTQALYQNLGGYMASYAYFDTKCKIKRHPEIWCMGRTSGCKVDIQLVLSVNMGTVSKEAVFLFIWFF